MGTKAVGSADWFSREWRRWLRKLGIAGVQALVFIACVLFHLGLRFAMKYLVPEGWVYLHRFLEAMVGLAFIGIYLALLIDTVVIFIPALGSIKEKLEGEK